MSYDATDLIWAHHQLAKNGLVAWTSGNCSERVALDKMIIKASGIACEDLGFSDVAYLNIANKKSHSGMKPKPSTDTDSHAFIYRNMPDINAIVHTHSRAATAWSTRRIAIPCLLTEMADTFGGPIPCAPYSEIGTEALGMAAYEVLKGSCANAVLLSNHGVLTVGKTIQEAVRNAIMVEHAASIALDCIYASPTVLEPDEIKNCFDRYSTSYGQ